MGLEQITSLKLDPVWWEEREARLSAKDEPPIRGAAPTRPAREPRSVAAVWIAGREARFRAGKELDRADQAYVLVLARRHGLPLADDFERSLRTILGWRQKPTIIPTMDSQERLLSAAFS
jgi:hypothetical protein